jgi:hypothetical protein
VKLSELKMRKLTGAAKVIQSIFNLATHEAVHAVLWRALGDDVEIIEADTGRLRDEPRGSPFRSNGR